MLTQKDLEEVEKLVRNVVTEEVKHLPNKEEFYTKMDELMGEIKTMREAQELHSGQHTEINDWIEKLKKQTGIPSAAL